MQSWRLVEKTERLEVVADVHLVGEDLLVVLRGGREHIGAVGLSEPRPGLQDPTQTGATSSVFTFPGHREDGPAKELADELARRLNRRVVVAAGMHWDNLDADGIAEALALCRRFGPAIAAAVGRADEQQAGT